MGAAQQTAALPMWLSVNVVRMIVLARTSGADNGAA